MSYLKKWWVLLIVAVLLAHAAWFLIGYIPHEYRMWKVEQYRDMVERDWESMQQEQRDLAEAYRNDSYGGKTPEETLRLFIEALRAQDYELASKYFVVENQEAELLNMPKGVSSGGIAALIDAYDKGSAISTPYENQDKYIIEVYPRGKEVPFGFVFILNPFTKKWKIVE